MLNLKRWREELNIKIFNEPDFLPEMRRNPRDGFEIKDNKLYYKGWKKLSRVISGISSFLTKTDIHPACTIGRRVFIDHAIGVVIGATAIVEDDVLIIEDLKDGLLDKQVGERDAKQLREDVELIEGVYHEFDRKPYLDADIAPVFFGSAINNFGVQELLETFIQIAPVPQGRETDARFVSADENKFSGFIFKIHANIDPRHRDRIAFLRVCSGHFERNSFYHHVRLDKNLRFNNPYAFLASSKDVIDEAFPGDVIGLYDTGNFKIGDTLTEGEDLMFRGIPSFSPEIFKELVNIDPMKTKQLDKGIQQLTDEGVAQLFIHNNGYKKVVGAVGELQFEVIQYRLENEYGAKCRFVPIQMNKACWLTTTDKKQLDEFIRLKIDFIYYDKDQNPVYMAETGWALNVAIENHPKITFHTTSDHHIRIA